MPKRLNIGDDVRFRVCEMFMNGATTNFIAKELGLESREQVYPILRAEKGRFLHLNPPRDQEIARLLCDRYRLAPAIIDPADGKPMRPIQVVNVRGATVAEHLATAAAEVVLKLTRAMQLTRTMQGAAGDEKEQAIHIGLGHGRTTQLTSRQFSMMLRSEPDPPKLALHALTGGWAPDRALESPVAQFTYFENSGLPADYVGLFAPALVRCGKEYEDMTGLPFVQESIQRAKNESDILLTSLGQAGDPHSLFNRAMEFPEAKPEALRSEGWIGDVQLIPFSRDGCLAELDSGLRAITGLEWEDLLRMASPDTKKHVVMVVGPCGRPKCGMTKTKALRALLDNDHKDRLRVLDHLIIDIATAEELQ